MAILKSDNLVLDIKFNSIEDSWIKYNIKFYWKDEIIIKDDILKRTGWWNKRSYGTFLANDYEKDYLIETIKKALDTNNPQCWEPMEPDAKLAIYPEMFFPFLKTPYNLFEELEEERKRKKEIHEVKDDDLFTVITFIDSYNFKDSCSYSGEGISLHLIVSRKDLEKFVADLQIEYDNIIR